ncbi:DUF4097 family beta strand repeat-containing protein [Bacillus pseudomycoides]|uniref:DUF4097 family beta strand repeat-containing protein n=1 Tax=Bacillus pseudomycoides TaxID=64104 RepID=UPI00032E20A3|nr:DUF4097 family beta strand repeat-containing protein [Bacillus pseudomycoides]EOP51630.1 hypothetical protein IIW_02385 [Bacillus cereus VD136]PEE39415.1 GNAT family acetyltransferase [Bacillus pseudomycoides]PEI92773.1 GNAT family acetyltransferase [Bacillus pseudomycoides]PGA90739.1 GNAT family acetyltransferase [Bacillus pseudomycoides]PHF50673.1 GNAT family acetyltransferase [Bacillus pseudomycoides]
MKKILLVAVACIIIGVVGISQTYSKTVDAAEKGETERVIKNEAIKNLEIDLDAGDVTVQKGDDSSFYIKQSGNTTKQKISIDEKGDILKVQGKIKKGISFDFSFLSFGFKTPGVTIVVPERSYQEIKVSSSAGEITVNDVKSERVEATTLGGDVEIERVTAKKVEGSSKAGGIKMKKVSGKVVAKTTSGDVDVIDHDSKYDVEASSTAGDVDIRLLEKPQDATVSGKTFAGEVKVFKEEERNVVVGNGSVKISGQTSAGDVTIEAN